MINQDRVRVRGKEGLSVLLCCTQLYNEMRLYLFKIVILAVKFGWLDKIARSWRMHEDWLNLCLLLRTKHHNILEGLLQSSCHFAPASS